MKSKNQPPMKQGSPDNFQTPPEALDCLVPFLNKDWTIWECACGRGNLVKGLAESMGNDFKWALDRLKEGKKVRRKSWSEGSYTTNTGIFSIDEINARDWEVYDKPTLYQQGETTQDTGSELVFRERYLKESINELKPLCNFDFTESEWTEKLIKIFGKELV